MRCPGCPSFSGSVPGVIDPPLWPIWDLPPQELLHPYLHHWTKPSVRPALLHLRCRVKCVFWKHRTRDHPKSHDICNHEFTMCEFYFYMIPLYYCSCCVMFLWVFCKLSIFNVLLCFIYFFIFLFACHDLSHISNVGCPLWCWWWCCVLFFMWTKSIVKINLTNKYCVMSQSFFCVIEFVHKLLKTQKYTLCFCLSYFCSKLFFSSVVLGNNWCFKNVLVSGWVAQTGKESREVWKTMICWFWFLDDHSNH